MSEVLEMSEEELKKLNSGGGGNSPYPKGTHEFTINRAEVKRDKSGKAYYKVSLQQRDGKRLLFDNYLTQDSTSGGFRRTKSLLDSIGLWNPAVKDGKVTVTLPVAEELIGYPVKNTVRSYQYSYGQGDNGYPLRISDWMDDFAGLEASGALEGATVEAEAGFYQPSDFLDEYIDAQADSAPVADVWGA